MTQKPLPRLLGRVITGMTVVTFAGATLLVLLARPALAQPAGATAVNPDVARWAFLAAALSAGLAALGAGYAVARVGSAAVGAVAEKPELFGRVLVLVGLAEGIAIYGLIVSILILNRVT
jgi:V/A-type H+-transporting ATPase subunit K